MKSIDKTLIFNLIMVGLAAIYLHTNAVPFIAIAWGLGNWYFYLNG